MRTILIFTLVALIATGCGATPATPGPSASPAAGESPSATAVPLPSATPSASPEPAIGIGSAVVTVSDSLRVRSAPGVSDDSIKYEPLLPLGTFFPTEPGPKTNSREPAAPPAAPAGGR